MAQTVTQNTMPRGIQWISRHTSLVVPLALVSLLGVIIVPLPPFLLDFFISTNLALAAIILLTTLYVRSPLDFSVFPSLLLATTLFRLVLNVASTRLILNADATSPTEVTGVAGQVIEAFGGFVAGGSVFVGIIIFIILIIVQFVVITKGATRISEVAARFTLDGMPGKQMAIDADLNAGTIDEHEARDRRETITREADFYGAMDGASKFVRGDAIAGIIITLVNIVGGFAIGVWQKGWPVGDTMSAFTTLTIGDGLVSQLPSFVIAIAAGLIVTRSSSKADLGNELTQQITGYPAAMAITAGFLAVLAFTGLPMIPMLMLSGTVATIAYFVNQSKKQTEANEQAAKAAMDQPDDQGPPPVEKLLSVDTLELEVGYGLVKLVDANQGGDLLERITMIRRQLAVDLGVVVPPVRIRDNMQLQPQDYHIKIRGNSVAHGQVFPGQYLAMDSGLASGELVGTRTHEPAFGLEAWWIEPSQKQRAETLNYTLVDASSVLATHLTETIRSHADELLSREETNHLIDQLREKAGKLVEEAIPTQIKPGELQKVLQNLLSERVPIRDMETIVETLSDWASRTKDMDVLTEYVRNALRRSICNQYVEMDDATGESRLYCVTLDPAMEDLINGYIERTGQGTTMTMPPAVANRITTAIVMELQKLIQSGHQPIVLTSPQVRSQVRSLLEPHLPNIAVLGYNEVSKGVEVESMGFAQLDAADVNGQLQGVTG